MTVTRSGLKVKVKVVGQANAVGPTSIEGSFYLVNILFVGPSGCYLAYHSVQH